MGSSVTAAACVWRGTGLVLRAHRDILRQVYTFHNAVGALLPRRPAAWVREGRSERFSYPIHRLRLTDHWYRLFHGHRETSAGRSFAEGSADGFRGGPSVDLVLVRFLFVLIIALTCYLTDPFNLPANLDAGVGGVIGLAIVLFEWRLRRVSLKRLIGAAIGGVLGIFGAYLFSLVIRNSVAPGHTQSFLQILVMLLMAYVGLVVGANKGDLLNLAALGGVFGGEKQGKKSYKILDTSVIIDGRIADIAETGFLDGTIVTPQFVLRELQLVADSADSLKRNRGRRGLDILQRLQKVPSLQIQIVEDDFPSVREVDLKLIELAKLYEGKIITNDFNLNKVAQLQGVAVLNINELANSLKPIVLPGETMRVFILKEGKEYNQGVAYLDDGTMVVVDNARKMIGKTIDISVTSVLQTTAGKMIFGKWDERPGSRSESRAGINAVSVASPAAPTAQSVDTKKASPLMVERPAE
jgi:uncharacterized protein YacL